MIVVKTERRYELKYLVPHDRAAEIRDTLLRYMAPDDHCDDSGCYQVTSLYYDTPDYRAYWDKINGHRNRRKLRVRVYGDVEVTPETPCFVEIKHRTDRALQKRRLVLPYCAAVAPEQFDEVRASTAERDRPVLDEVQYLHRALQLRPACVVSYCRRALAGGEYDTGLRVTFDTDLKYRTHELSLLANGQSTNHYFLPPDWCIMEVKINQRAPLWLTDVIGKYQCVLRRVSKYCTALEHSRVLLDRQRINE